ncbi:right-handed parallel beta-helix repeat-containing protein [Streptomyces sp. HUAS MG47]|uniref:right-handed parallel beta-helix repeat-containing protein n=1 Tax=Streptomyces solicamelliae TaxID=3231716 RepID=UPI0038784014
MAVRAVMRSRTKRTAAGVSAAALLLLTGCDVPGVYRPARPASGGPFTFYVSPDGDDKNDGMSPETAWRTLAHADDARFRPGDRLRLKGGARFPGRLTLGRNEAGSAIKPVIIESYGTGRAVVVTAGTSAIAVRDTGGVEIRNVSLVGAKGSLRYGEGISFLNKRPDGRRLDHVRISNVDVSGFRNGISVEAGAQHVGFSDVRITDSAVHHNLEAGISFDGPDFEAESPVYAHQRVRIERVKAYRNSGDPDEDYRNTGSGIKLGSVRDGKVQRSVAHDNGAKSSANADEGPEGIWVFDSTRVVLEHNTSYRNRTGSTVDGGGFGLDNNVSSSVMQYNLAYGNDGPGFLVYSGMPTGAHKNNIVRFNMSWDDARSLPDYGGIVAFGTRMKNLDIYHNTVVMRTDGLQAAEDTGERPPALRLRDGMRNVRVHNNIFVTDGGPLVEAQSAYSPQYMRLQGNDYYSTGDWGLLWGDKRYRTLAAWRQASRQEILDGDPTGSKEDPCLRGMAAPVTDRAGAGNLVPRCAGEVPAGLTPDETGVDPGPVDYFGTRLGSAPTVGAAQPRTDD